LGRDNAIIRASPNYETDCRRLLQGHRGTILPPASHLENVNDAADDPSIVDAPGVGLGLAFTHESIAGGLQVPERGEVRRRGQSSSHSDVPARSSSRR
jgi:hypothetical protein